MERILKRNICFVTTVHPFEDIRIYHKEIKSLINNGYKINYIVKNPNEYKSSRELRIYSLAGKNTLAGRIFNNALALLFSLKSKSTIFHIHDPELIILGIILKVGFRKTIIYDIHELYFNSLLYKSYLPYYLAKIVSKVYIILEKIGARFFDVLVLAEAEYAKYYNAFNRKIIVLQNFIPSNRIVRYPVKMDDDSEIQFVYVGSITRVRGIYEMIEFCKILRNNIKFQLHLIGPFYPNKLEEEIKLLIHRDKLNKIIKIYGQLPFEKAQNLVKKFDIGLIFLHPILNHKTILSTKMFEYMGNGLVVFMTDIDLWQTFNRTYSCGLTLNIFDLKKEREKITKFVGDILTINKIKKNNIKTVKNQFIWELEEKKLVTLYNNLLRNTNDI